MLWGPRYRARDCDTPFVGLTAGSRPIRFTDIPALVAAARDGFAEFPPGYLNLWTAGPGPHLGRDPRRQPAARRAARAAAARPVPRSVTVHPAADFGFSARYVDIQEEQFRADPVHRPHTRVETEENPCCSPWVSGTARTGLPGHPRSPSPSATPSPSVSCWWLPGPPTGPQVRQRTAPVD